MRSHPLDYELITPQSLSEALDLLAQEPGVWRAFAGGTDLMVLFEAGKLTHYKFINIWNFPELKGIEASADEIILGALATYTEIQAHPVLQTEFPMLCQAASETGGLAIQNRGTIGGNIVNASPAADSPPALLVYDAQLDLISRQGVRTVPYKDFHTGYKRMLMREDELLWRVRLPRNNQLSSQYYYKVGTRKAQAISKVCFAAAARVEDHHVKDVRLALGSVAPTVVRCVKTEEALRDQELNEAAIKSAREALAQEIAPIDDIRSTSLYRLRVSQNLLEDFLSKLGADGADKR